jgi:hypothetical protein
MTNPRHKVVKHIRRLVCLNNIAELHKVPLWQFPKGCEEILQDAVCARAATFLAVLAIVATLASKRRMTAVHFRQSMLGGMMKAISTHNVAALRQLIAVATARNVRFNQLNCFRLMEGICSVSHGEIMDMVLAAIVDPRHILCAHDQVDTVLQKALFWACERGSKCTDLKRVLRLCEARRMSIPIYEHMKWVLGYQVVAAARVLTEYPYVDADDAARLSRGPGKFLKSQTAEFIWGFLACDDDWRHPMEFVLRSTPAVLDAALVHLPWAREFMAHYAKWCLRYTITLFEDDCRARVQTRTFVAMLNHACAPDWTPYLPEALKLACYRRNTGALVAILSNCDKKAVARVDAGVLPDVRRFATNKLAKGEHGMSKVLELLG